MQSQGGGIGGLRTQTFDILPGRTPKGRPGKERKIGKKLVWHDSKNPYQNFMRKRPRVFGIVKRRRRGMGAFTWESRTATNYASKKDGGKKKKGKEEFILKTLLLKA